MLLAHSHQYWKTFDYVGSTSTKHNKSGALVKDVKLVVDELVKAKSFDMQQKGRKHRRFPHSKDPISFMPKESIVWLIGKLAIHFPIHACSCFFIHSVQQNYPSEF